MEKIHTCKICGNKTDNIPFKAKELMLGLKHEFNYFECSNCLSLQIENIPENVSDYYASDYISFNKHEFSKKLTWFRSFTKRKLASYYSGNFNLEGYLLSFFYPNPFPWIVSKVANFNSRILDIGCGNGKHILSMQRSGYKNLTGIDPYIVKDVIYDNGVSIYKKDLFDLTGQFDMIMLNHSFEHMDSPLKVLEKLKTLLSKDGYILIRIPVSNSFAWRKYRTNWIQLDAPRHFFLHTTKSMTILTEQSGLEIENIIYESTSFQFTGSEKYLRGLKYEDADTFFSPEQIKAFDAEAKHLNEINDGDTACFYLKKSNL
jgi:2-polyprenyl-3-methyl-5-hydroxy-6-metoxy-1,4-benzoquinol methylase